MADDLREFGSYEQMLEVHRQEKFLFMHKIAEDMAEKAGVPLDKIRGPSHLRELANARFPMWKRLHGIGYILDDIGSYFGGRHHTTIMHGIRRAKEIREREEKLKCSN